MSARAGGSARVNRAEVVLIQIDALPLDQEVPTMTSDVDPDGIELKLPLHLLDISPGSGFGGQHGQVPAAERRAPLAPGVA